MTLTPWFDHKKKPVHPGVYEVRELKGYNVYSHWNGKWWGLQAFSPKWAELYQLQRSSRQRFYWRGLAEKP